MTFIGSDLRGSSKVSYFFETTKKITLFSNLLGHQKHLNGNTISGSLNSLPLGSLKQNIIQSQISIEESQFVFFNINALKYSDAPGQIGSNPSGISSEEANQLAYLAGRSTKNKFFIFYGLEEIDKDQDLLTHNLIAQMSWYYLEGSKNPVIRPEQIQNKQEYYIESSLYSDNLKYIKDLDTGLWFHKIPFELSSEYADYQWILSNHQEYIETSNEDIPYRLLEMYDNLKSTF
ncbi:hypothetical protein [Membranihabitans marinus]|uniref:hypothetical protein n=1 Tax=Membranihabitans marinus TaxID=1227546 RepID=UPI001F2C3607|nr:hypothetical protein [Membranihabitans marinus]